VLFLVPLINVLHLVRFTVIFIILVCFCASASEMTCIVSSGALNSTHSLTCFCAGACAEHCGIVMENATDIHNPAAAAAADVSNDVQDSNLNGLVET